MFQQDSAPAHRACDTVAFMERERNARNASSSKHLRQLISCWVRPPLSAESRQKFGHYDRLMAELRMEDQQSFFNFLRMPPQMFDELLNRVGHVTKWTPTTGKHWNQA